MSTEHTATQLERILLELLGMPTATRARLAVLLLHSLEPKENPAPAATDPLEQELLSLPIATRERLVEQLIKGLEHDEYPPQEEVERHWMEVVKRRADDFESGRTEGIPSEEVFRKLREKYG